MNLKVRLLFFCGGSFFAVAVVFVIKTLLGSVPAEVELGFVSDLYLAVYSIVALFVLNIIMSVFFGKIKSVERIFVNLGFAGTIFVIFKLFGR